MIINGRNVYPCPNYEPYMEHGCLDAPEWVPNGSMLCWYPDDTFVGEYSGGVIDSFSRDDSEDSEYWIEND